MNQDMIHVTFVYISFKKVNIEFHHESYEFSSTGIKKHLHTFCADALFKQ